MQLNIAGENSFILYVGEQISDQVSARIYALQQQFNASLSDVVIDMVPSYCSILLYFDNHKITPESFKTRLLEAVDQCVERDELMGREVVLPVYYGHDVGLDLQRVADHAGMSIEQVIDCHQGGQYRVYAIGFAPGFAYLGQLDERIAMARLDSPRLKVPKGAVAIAERQTAIYPAPSPGGWNIIGRCSTTMFSPENDPVMPVSVGDKVRFERIDKAEFQRRGGQL